jgi:pyruvate/2-oxoglutarate dehydrogenase complex dihydrolipoamide acyltransferase (E2) component
MRVPIEMPKLGYDMETGRIVSWLKAEGDRVARGEPIAEIETDKATIEMEARASGVIVEILQPAGSEVPVGTPIGTLETDA